MTSRRTRALGQHLLVDARVAKRQAEYAALSGADTVLEVGPGKGVLTRFLAAGAGKVIAIEKDRRFLPFLSGLPENVELLFADALKVDLPRFNKVVSNLPYSISSPITFRLLERDFELAVLMYQKEFADRMCASVGSPDYSRLSVEVYRRASCRILEGVPPSAFFPLPRVRSAIVELRPRPCPFPAGEEAAFSAVARALFSHRRKSVENALRAEKKVLGELAEALERAGPPMNDHRLKPVVSIRSETRGCHRLKAVVSSRMNDHWPKPVVSSLMKRRAESLSPEEIGALTEQLVSPGTE